MALFTAKMQDALQHFAVQRNKAAAYRHAYDTSAMASATIQHEAHLLFKHPLMAAAVSSMQAVAAATVKIDAVWVLKRAALLADFNINKFIHVESSGIAVYDFSEATDDDWYCISEYTVKGLVRRSDNTYMVDEIKIKATCKLQALKLVGQHIAVGAFKDQLELTGALGIAQISTGEYKAARQEMLNEDEC